MAEKPTFADITTIRIGGPIGEFVEPSTKDEFIDTLDRARQGNTPLFVIGGGSNVLVSDQGFDGIVVRDARRGVEIIEISDRDADSAADSVSLRVDAGKNLDEFVAWSIEQGYAGIEALSGIPGTVGASVVQNVGAYGAQVADVVLGITVFDRLNGQIRVLGKDDLEFGYRTSVLKTTLRDFIAFFPSPRFVVIDVTFVLQRSSNAPVRYAQLAQSLKVELGSSMSTAEIRYAVLTLRASKGMLEDPNRYENPWMRSTRESVPDYFMPSGEEEQHNRWSCGSFFTNPIVDESVAEKLPEDAPRYPAGVDSSGAQKLKLSAAWLIDHAGFHKGFSLNESCASLSTFHTLALTNRGGANFSEMLELMQAVREGVEKIFGVQLVPEPVIVQ
jgi:UDP-N-acetylmuramate dehydrogenase